MDLFDWVVLGIKCGAVFIVLVHVVPVMVWVERRGMALMQIRLGPNRVGPLGLFQSLADAVKMFFKEDRAPGNVNKFYYTLAPFVSVVPAFMTLAVVPFASSLVLPNGREVLFQLANLDIGLLYVFAISSLSVYGIIMAGWASNSKYAIFGGLRSTSQMISYEVPLGLSVIGVIMVFGSLSLMDISKAQGEVLMTLGPLAIPKWGIFVQPVGFLVFMTAVFAETNRTPFDLPEGESEIVAGYHLEYGSMKFALFMMAEYLHMTTASAMMATLYFGGWQLLPGMRSLMEFSGLSGFSVEVLRVGFEILSFTLKTAFFMWLFVWVRWSVPRFRYDQLMALGWKVMLPLALINIFGTGILIYLGMI